MINSTFVLMLFIIVLCIYFAVSYRFKALKNLKEKYVSKKMSYILNLRILTKTEVNEMGRLYLKVSNEFLVILLIAWIAFLIHLIK